MSVNLQKGQNIELTRNSSGGLKKIMVALGWDKAEQKGFLPMLFGRSTVDCDAAAIICGADDRAVGSTVDDCCIYFGCTSHKSGSIIHMGDNLTGEGDGDNEQIMVDLPNVPEEIKKIVFVVNIYDARTKKQHFGMIKNAFIRLVNTESNAEICRFNLSDNYSGMTGIVAGELCRINGQWKFNAIGHSVAEASRLDMLIALYK